MNLLIIGSGEWTRAALSVCPPSVSAYVTETPSAVDLSTAHILLGPPSALVDLIPQCPKLKWVQSTWAGVDTIAHFANDRIKVTALKGVFGQAMSEYVIGWLLAVERNIVARAAARSWLDMTDGTVAGKTVGIMGAGSIGSAVATACSAIGMRCRGLNSNGRPQRGFEACYAPTDRLAFAHGLDYLVSVLPNTPATNQLVDSALLDRLAPGAIFINVGRGNVVNEADLVAALASGRLRSAVLDVFTTEPLPKDHFFWSTQNLHITAHTAAPTPTNAVHTVFKENLHRFLRNEPLLHCVCATKGY